MAEQLSQGVAKMTLSAREERVTQKQLNILAANLGAEWESLARHLGLTKAQLDACKADNHLSVHSQKFAMLMKWRARAGKNATVTELVEKLRTSVPEPIDENAFEFLLPLKEQTDELESGLAEAATPVESGQTEPTSVDPRLDKVLTKVDRRPTENLRLIPLWQLASAIAGVNFTPDRRGGKKEEERLQKIKQWEAPLKKRVENYSSSINYSIDYEGFSAINDSMKSVCLIKHPNGYGTGFLIGPRHVITANHVLIEACESFGQVTNPQRFLVHFHISGVKKLTFTFRPDIIAACDGNLDYAIIEIHAVSPTDNSAVSEVMQTEGICPLGTKIAASLGNEDIVVIVGHPGGLDVKKADFCPVVGVDAVTSQAITLLGYPDNPLGQWPEGRSNMGSYQSSVMFEGSSGSPCFTKHGNVVLMHLKGFRPYSDQPSIVEMGVLLSTVKIHAQGILPSDVFSEIFGS